MTTPKAFKTEDLDTNLKLSTNIPKQDIAFYDAALPPIQLYGLQKASRDTCFLRMPPEIAKNTSDGVNALNAFTAGGRVRFSTDSSYIAIKVKMPAVHPMYHMPTSGVSGFDLYIDAPAGSYFRGVLPPDYSFTGGEFEAWIDLGERVLRSYTIHFPLYDNVDQLYIGLQERAQVSSGLAYTYDKPIVYYGSSITQGGCASRPGLSYQNMISRRLNVDHINLGFSGNGKAEDAIVNYMATLDPLIFVSDYDHNAPSLDHLDHTHRNLYQTVRAAHPELPYIMISKPDFLTKDCIARRKIIHDHFMEGIAQGDRNLYFIDGESFFGSTYDKGDCTVDGCHPNDHGFALMAERIGNVINMILKEQRYR